jgi:hypothetical protein
MMPVYRTIDSVFGHLPAFLAELDDSLISIRSLKAQLSDAARRLAIRLQLATVVHVGRELEVACYTLEGDGALIFIADEVLATVLAKLAPDAQIPLPLMDVLRAECPDPHGLIANSAYVRSLWEPCRLYLLDQMGKHASSYHIMKLARVWHPQLAKVMTNRQIVDVLLDLNVNLVILS